METPSTLSPELPDIDAIGHDLSAQGWSVQPGFFDPRLVDGLLAETLALEANDLLRRAGIGRGDAFKVDEGIRCDKTRWLTGSTPAQRLYLERMENLRIGLNRSLFLGLTEYECHFALYEKGAYYRKHYDSFRGRANRVVTTVAYLNQGWKDDEGGFLHIYNGKTDLLDARVSPEAGKLVIFMSEEVPHEVAPTFRRRAGLAGWYRCRSGADGPYV